LLLNPVFEYIEFALVALLGFMPLIVIHWSDRQRRKEKPSQSQRGFWHMVIAIKAAVIVAVTDWASNLWI